MKEQLYKFTNKWYGYIPNEVDLCSFTLKTIFAMLKFGGLVALVLQPVVFGPLGFMLDRLEGLEINLAGVFYITCASLLILYAGLVAMAVVTFLGWRLSILVQHLRDTFEKVRCSKTIKFTDEDD